LPLEGRATENGTYECRWNNSRGEARHRQFIVSFIIVGIIDLSEAKSFATVNGISITFALLFAIGVGITIKIYLDKVSDEREFFSQHVSLLRHIGKFNLMSILI
jgi:hypothetical protein